MLFFSMKRLTELKPGESGKVIAIFCSNESGFARRLAALGIVTGKEIEVINKSFFTPIHIRVGMTEIMLRKKDAHEIWIR